MIRHIGIIFLLITCVSCKKESLFHYAEDDVMMVESLPQDFLVPQEIWDQMLPKIETDKAKKIIYTSARVIFREKNKDILKNPLMVLEFPRGGGEIDLADVTRGNSGTFYLKFEFPEAEKALKTQVFFISESRQRKVDNEVIGSGCKKVLDITSAFLAAQGKEGLVVNTTRHRHASILGGHFVVLAEMEKNWLMTQVTFYDSSRTDLFCPDFRKVE